MFEGHVHGNVRTCKDMVNRLHENKAWNVSRFVMLFHCTIDMFRFENGLVDVAVHVDACVENTRL